MARMTICKGCGKKLQPDEKMKHGSKVLCKSCYDRSIRDADGYRSLMSYICKDIFEIERPTGLILKQVKEMRNEYNYPYSAIQYTLWYCKEILELTFQELYGIALVKIYYDEAKQYYLHQDRLIQQMNNITKDDIKTNVVKKKKSLNEKDTNSPLINLEDLLKGVK